MTKRERIERRSSDRTTVACPVTLIANGQLHYTQTCNLSENGLFINDDHGLGVGGLVNVILTLPDRRLVSAAAEICFVQPGVGAGIKFLNLKSSDRQEVRQLIRRHYDEQRRDESRRHTRTRRKESRSKIALHLNLHRSSTTTPHPPLRVRTEDISRHGTCLIAPLPLEVGEVITLTCVQAECELRAVVKYTHGDGERWRTGVQFLSFPKKWLIMELAVSALLEGGRLER